MRLLRWSTLLPFIFGTIATSFVIATAFTEWRMADLDRAALEIVENSAPSIEYLAEARGEMRQLQLLLRDNLDQDLASNPGSPEVERTRDRMNQAINGYLLLPILPGEKDKWAEILQQKDAVNAAVGRFISAAARGEVSTAEGLLRGDVALAADALCAAFARDIEFNAGHSRELARRIRARHISTKRAALGLDVVCAFITFAGAVALRRAMRAHAELGERHRRFVEERAAELEQFAGRIAHDILSPLSTVSLALQLVGRPGTEAQRPELLDRGTRAILRVRRLVDGLLGFAQAGARPVEGACADVNATIGDLAGELEKAAAEAGAELHVDTHVTHAVACSAGALTSVVANLARNAIKYIGEGPVRRIDIRARDEGKSVHVEVQDTGPGLPAGFEGRAFEPFTRGRTDQPGVGLGLATVKRMVEGHGGRVGVHSIPGQGCTFWFELPFAADATTAEAVAEPAHV